MSDTQLKVQVNRIIGQSGYTKNEEMYCSIMKVLKMRNKDLNILQAKNVVKEILH